MNNKNLFIYIEGGKYKGKKLFLPSSKSTRSTKSIVKNSFFDTVQFELYGKIFFEVFGGSGSMGLEAISRGADFAYFIEKNKDAYNILLKNCSLIDKNKTEVFLDNSFTLYDKIISMIEEKEKKAYIYLDPPFEIREGMSNVYEEVYKLIEKTPKNTAKMFILEHRSAIKTPDQIGSFKKKKTKKFGKTSLSYWH